MRNRKRQHWRFVQPNRYAQTNALLTGEGISRGVKMGNQQYVLDVGCGQARKLSHLAEVVGMAVGIDIRKQIHMRKHACMQSRQRRIFLQFLMLNAKLGLTQAVTGIDYSRCMEYPLVVERLKISKDTKVLDVGSDISIFPLFLSLQGCSVHAIDINPRVFRQVEYLKKMGLAQAIRSGKFQVEVQDVRTLPYPDDTFDRITMVSTLEHIHDDTRVMHQCERVLKTKGRIVVTVPYGRVLREIRNKRGLTRIYDDRAILTRVLIPRLKLVAIDYFGDDGFGKIWYRLPTQFRYLVGLFGSWASRFQTFFAETDRGKAGGCCICLEK